MFQYSPKSTGQERRRKAALRQLRARRAGTELTAVAGTRKPSSAGQAVDPVIQRISRKRMKQPLACCAGSARTFLRDLNDRGAASKVRLRAGTLDRAGSAEGHCKLTKVL